MEEEIKRIKREKNAAILAHNYQLPEVQDIADFVGDSLELAKKALQIDCKNVFVCGVTFMAETVAILNPSKKVYIPSLEAVCPLASSLRIDELDRLKSIHQDAITILYINTEAIAKARADIICTSANAVDIVEEAPSKKVIFGPDSNLAYYVRKNCRKDKEIIVTPEYGGCYVHLKFTVDDIISARKRYPDAVVIVHPECIPAVQDRADFIGSTGQMIKFCATLPQKKIIIGTEKEMCYRLKKLYPEKEFIPLREDAVCEQMKKITLNSLYDSMRRERYRIDVPPEIATPARRAIERMIKGW